MYKEQLPKQHEIRIPLASSIHKPNRIFLALQQLERDNSQNHDSMLFDHLNLEECFVEVISVRFPDSPIKMSFDVHNYAEV